MGLEQLNLFIYLLLHTLKVKAISSKGFDRKTVVPKRSIGSQWYQLRFSSLYYQTVEWCVTY